MENPHPHSGFAVTQQVVPAPPYPLAYARGTAAQDRSAKLRSATRAQQKSVESSEGDEDSANSVTTE
jgi:hypothetical protein